MATKKLHGSPAEKACAKAQTALCQTNRLWNVPACKECQQTNAAKLKAAQCTPQDLTAFCGGEPGPVPRKGPNGEAHVPKGWPATVMLKSTDDGLTWSQPQPVWVNNTWGPHWTGGGP